LKKLFDWLKIFLREKTMPKIILCCESSVKEGWLVKDENENRFHAIHKEDISEGYEPPKRGEFLNGYAVAEAYADSVYGLCLSYRSDDPREDPASSFRYGGPKTIQRPKPKSQISSFSQAMTSPRSISLATTY
jgi:hypothetical protein